MRIDFQIKIVLFAVLKSKFILLFIVFFRMLPLLHSKEVYYSQLNNLNGLQSNKIYDIIQDKNGFLWLGSEVGLLNYNNKYFKKYVFPAQSSMSVSNIKEDKFGRIWFMNFDGFVFYVQNDIVKKLSTESSLSYQPFTISNNRIFVVQKQGFKIFDLKTLKLIKSINFNTEFIESSTVSIDDEIFFASKQELYKIDKKFNILKAINSFKPNFYNAKLAVLDNNLFWSSQYNYGKRIYQYNSDLKFLKEHRIEEIQGINHLNFIENSLWISTNNGLFQYEFFENNLSLKNSILNNYASSKVIRDYQKNYWISTLDNGIFKIADLSVNIIDVGKYAPNIFLYNKDKYIVGTKRGELLFVKDKDNIKTEKFEGNPIVYQLFTGKNGDIFASAFGTYWTNNYKTINLTFATKDICEIDHKYYAMATSGQVVLLEKNNIKTKSDWDNKFDKLNNIKNSDVYLIENKIRAKTVCYDTSNKIIYFSGNHGLFYLSINEKGAISNSAYPILYASKLYFIKQRLYALTSDGNLFLIEKQKKNFNINNLNLKFGIKENSIKIIKNYKNQLFILSENGFYEINTKENEFKKLNLEFNIDEVVDFCLKNDSILSILTDKFILEKEIFNNTLTNVQSKFKIVTLKSNSRFLDLKKYNKLKFSENNIEIEFANLNFISDSENKIFYKINDNNWVKVNHELNVLSFQKLNEGKYEISFKIGENIHPEQVQFYINAPFFRTWWFYLLLFLSVVFITYFIYNLRLKNIKKEVALMSENMRLEKELNKSIVTSIKSQMNPHFFYNALNTIQSFLYTDKKREASNYLAKFSDLTRNILEMSDKESIKLTEEIETLKLYLELEKMRFEEEFTYQINIHQNLEVELINIPSMLIQPYVENALKHGLLHKTGEKKLMINFEKNENLLKVIIEDNGIGRVQSENYKTLKQKNMSSFATKANQKRLELINQFSKNQKPVEIIDLYNQNQEAIGTKVILHIPIN